MKKYFITSVLLFCWISIMHAQSPQLTVNGKTNNGVVLQSLSIDIQVCGTIAKTSWQMEFKNNTNRVLEGTLNFPLKEGVTVSRYALDINGKMREAVPVDRGKGAMVFEAIERRRVDPGLLEKVEGNTFRTRIYPINPHSKRTVIIGYEEELAFLPTDLLRYHLPLGLKDTIASFSLKVQVLQSAATPFFDNAYAVGNIRFDHQNQAYTADMHKTNYVPAPSMAFSIPMPMDAPEVILQEFENKYYYLVNTRISKKDREKQLPREVALLWDASLSGRNRNAILEMALLEAYFKKLNHASISLVVFSNKIYSTSKYILQNGQWQGLKKAIDSIQYDGGTNLGSLHLDKITADEFLLMSDGHQTFGTDPIRLGRKPVYCVNSASSADYSSLQAIALRTGGAVIDLQKDGLTTALEKLTMEPFRFLGIRKNSAVEESYPAIPVSVSNSFSVAGMAGQQLREIVLQFGYGSTVSMTKKILIDPDRQMFDNFDISRVFAQKKIAELDTDYENNKQAIESLGKRFGLVTRNTSLIVLETVQDYIQYEVEPPVELMPEYNRVIKQRGSLITLQERNHLQTSQAMLNELKNWWSATNQQRNPVSKKTVVERQAAAVRQRRDRSDDARQVAEQKLQEVIVTGYGTQKRMDVTGSVSSNAPRAIREEESLMYSPSHQLEGRVPGIAVTGQKSVGASINNQIRGNAAAAPILYLVNGVIGNPNDLQPDEISHMEVLQGNAATALYGQKAASGVVVITTKKGTAASFDSIYIPVGLETADYIKLIRLTDKANRYNKYLSLRSYHIANPVYYFEVASYFLKTGDAENAVKILSNLAEMETGSYELYKMLGYKLKESGDYTGEIIAFKKVLELRPLDPQSYRDYALALEDAGRHQEALDHLYLGMTKSYSHELSRIYAGIEEIFLVEINRLIVLYAGRLKLKQIPKSVIKPLPVDLRVVMNWNKNNTDIDLWVTDPDQEKCMYSHKATMMGGRISDDFTDGLGPEQFILKNAKRGKYRIEINYFGDSQATIAGATTVMAEIYLHYGMPHEEKRIVTLQMEKGKSGPVFIGEVTL